MCTPTEASNKPVNKTTMYLLVSGKKLKLVAIEIQFRVRLDISDKMAMVLDVSPEEYKLVITTERRSKRKCTQD